MMNDDNWGNGAHGVEDCWKWGPSLPLLFQASQGSNGCHSIIFIIGFKFIVKEEGGGRGVNHEQAGKWPHDTDSNGNRQLWLSQSPFTPPVPFYVRLYSLFRFQSSTSLCFLLPCSPSNLLRPLNQTSHMHDVICIFKHLRLANCRRTCPLKIWHICKHTLLYIHLTFAFLKVVMETSNLYSN